MRIITVRSGFLSEESVTHNINVNPPLPNGGTLSSFFKKALYRFIKDLCQAPQLNIGYCPCLILDSRNGATADIDSNCRLIGDYAFYDVRNFFTCFPIRFIFSPSIILAISSHSEIHLNLRQTFRYRTNTKNCFVLTQDNYFDILNYPFLCPVIRQNKISFSTHTKVR